MFLFCFVLLSFVYCVSCVVVCGVWFVLCCLVCVVFGILFRLFCLFVCFVVFMVCFVCLSPPPPSTPKWAPGHQTGVRPLGSMVELITEDWISVLIEWTWTEAWQELRGDFRTEKNRLQLFVDLDFALKGSGSAHLRGIHLLFNIRTELNKSLGGNRREFPVEL